MRDLIRRPWLPPLLLLLLLLLIYGGTLQTIPNGAEHYFMIDVGETQAVLNTWGTLHATGYPLYVMLNSGLVALLKLIGVGAATAPAVTSLLTLLLALLLLYGVGLALLGRDKGWLVAGIVLIFGLTRTVWIHAVIAEIYAFGLLLLALLLLIALWPGTVRGRLYWLAFIGGLAVFHHRGLLMVAPALLLAAWCDLVAHPKPHPRLASSDSPSLSTERGRGGEVILRRIVICLLLGLVGFLPYLYLPLRATAGAAWVYGEPNTWGGFWDQFLGREAERFIGAPATLDGLAANFNLINSVLVTDLTLPGLLIGLVGLIIGLLRPQQRRDTGMVLLSGVVAYGFHVLLYTDVLSQLILAATLTLALGWLLAADALWTAFKWLALTRRTTPRVAFPTTVGGSSVWAKRLSALPIALLIGLAAIQFISFNQPFIHDLTTDRTGLDTIAIAAGTPPGATLMLDWGPRYFAVGLARDVLGSLPGLALVSHKVDFRALAEAGELVTADFTFYNRPLSWWEQQLGATVYLRAAAPHLVEIATQPQQAEVAGDGIQLISQRLTCSADQLHLTVEWASATRPTEDWSVFVHALAADGTLVGQGDVAAPVFGWRPLTTWEAGEMVRDVYSLPRSAARSIRYGFYTRQPDGAFENRVEHEITVECDES